MVLSNIDKFNEMTGKIFADLYENFSQPLALTPGCYIDGGEDAVIDDKSVNGAKLMPEAEFFMHTVDWLVQEKYIAIKSRETYYFRGATLTSAALAVLNSTPNSLQNKTPLGERLILSTKNGASDILKTVAKEALSIGLKNLIS